MLRLKQIVLSLSIVSSLYCANALQATEFAKPVIEIADADDLKGITKVAVTSFTVQYVTEQVWDTTHFSQGYLQTSGQGGGFSVGKSLDSAKLQATTDAIYKEFMKNLKATGLDVVSSEQLAGSEAYKTFLSKGPKTPRVEEAEAQSGNGAGAITSVFYTPTGMTMAIDDDIDYLKSGMMSVVSDPTLTFTGRLGLYGVNFPYYDKDVQKELGAATLHVRVYVPLAKVDVKTGTMIYGHGYSKQAIEPGLRLGERFTRVAVGKDGDYARMYLKEPLLIPNVVDSKIVELDHPNVVRAMMGEKIKTYPATLNVENYWKIMPEAVNYTLNQFAIKLKENIR